MCPTIGRGGCHPKPGGSSSRRLVPAQAVIWEVDPLSCPRCGHEMKIISLIHELDVIERILRHLGLWKQPPDPHEGKIKALRMGRLFSIVLTMAGPDMKSPSSSTTKRHRWTDPPPATTGAVYSQIRGIQPLSRPPQSRQRAR